MIKSFLFFVFLWALCWSVPALLGRINQSNAKRLAKRAAISFFSGLTGFIITITIVQLF